MLKESASCALQGCPFVARYYGPAVSSFFPGPRYEQLETSVISLLRFCRGNGAWSTPGWAGSQPRPSFDGLRTGFEHPAGSSKLISNPLLGALSILPRGFFNNLLRPTSRTSTASWPNLSSKDLAERGRSASIRKRTNEVSPWGAGGGFPVQPVLRHI